MFDVLNCGQRFRTSSTGRDSYGMRFRSHHSRVVFVNGSSSALRMTSPVVKKTCILSGFAYSASHCFQRCMATRAHCIHSSPFGRSPYELRTPRVSSPDVERELPGPSMSTSVTLAPMRRRLSAVHPPQAPAPTTTMLELERPVLRNAGA